MHGGLLGHDAALLLHAPHPDRLHHLAFLHASARDRLFHRHHDDVADGGVFALRTAEHFDAHDAPRAGIIRHVEVGLHLNHDATLVLSISARTALTRPSSSRPEPLPTA